MKKLFTEYQLSDSVKRALADMQFTEATPVQARTIDRVMAGEDLIVRAKTGSGKTAAFGIPIVEKLTTGNAPKVLIMTPTRELAIQVNNDIKHIAKYKKLRVNAVYGQHNINTEIDALTKGVDIVTGTPGRVLDHLERRTLYADDIAYLVLDEADRMLDMGFIDQVMAIVKQLPKARQTLLFSATMPFEIQTIAWEYMKDPTTVEIESDTKTVDLINQGYFKVEHRDKRACLHTILRVHKPSSCIVFCNTRRMVDRLTEYLNMKGYQSEPLHGALTQARRLKTINRFKKGTFKLLVATDVAARGIHVDDLDMVINYDLPIERDNYIHRIGRTGRAGNDGVAYSIVTSDDVMTLYEIEEHIGAMIEELPLPKLQHKRQKQTKQHHKSQGKRLSKGRTQSNQRPKNIEAKQLSRKVYRGKAYDSQPHQMPSQPVTQRGQSQYSDQRVAEVIANYKAKKPAKRTFWDTLLGWLRRS